MGATGDLTHRKLMPSLYNLAVQHMLPHGFSIVGLSRQDQDDEQFRNDMRASVSEFSRFGSVRPQVWDSFADGLFFHRADFSDEASYRALGDLLRRVDEERGTHGNHVFYLATPPSTFGVIVEMLGKCGLVSPNAVETPWTRIVIEKPFGRDLESALALNKEVLSCFSEDQVYRIDHYLGKETVQNILVFRFANGIFEPIWNRRYIDNVQITVSEELGIGRRAGYYDRAGALRDMVQSHMLQLLSLTCMEPPVALDAKSLRDEKVKVIRSVQRYSPEEVAHNVVRGQYGPGWIGGNPVEGYRAEEGVPSDSVTESYVALKLSIENWRWGGTPFYLRTGKRLPRRETEIAVTFKRAPHALFRDVDPDSMSPNVLAMRIQPDESISLQFLAKAPGVGIDLQPVDMDFLYRAAFTHRSADAYERLLLDVMLGDSSLFTRGDEVEASWRIITPILDAWQQAARPAFPNYEAGTWGPAAARALVNRDGQVWRLM